MRAHPRQRERAVGVRLVVTLPNGKEVTYEIDRQEIAVGRDPKNDIPLADPLVSEFHAKLVLAEDGTVRLLDLQSANKTRLNGLEVSEAVLRCGDEVQFARVKCRVAERPTYEDSESRSKRASRTSREPSAPTEVVVRRLARSGRFKLFLVLGLLLLFSLLSALATRVMFGR